MFVLEEWERCMAFPKGMPGFEKENREAVLIQMLEEWSLEEKELQAAILLTKFYSSGIKRDAKKMASLIEKVTDIQTDIGKLTNYFDCCLLGGYLKDAEYQDAHCAIMHLFLPPCAGLPYVYPYALMAWT